MWPRSWPGVVVADSAFVAEFFEFADVVQKGRGEQEIDVELGIMTRHNFSHAQRPMTCSQQAAE